MKQIIHKTLGIAIIAFFSQTAMATDVTSNFTTGATLTAAQMTEIKDAVNSKQNINQSAGAAISTSGGVALTIPEAVIVTLSINAPASGVIVVNTSGYIDGIGSGAVAVCSITTTVSTDYSNSTLIGGATPNPLYIPFAVTTAYTVLAAGTQTYNLVCYLSALTPSGYVVAPKLTAIFVPNSY